MLADFHLLLLALAHLEGQHRLMMSPRRRNSKPSLPRWFPRTILGTIFAFDFEAPLELRREPKFGIF